MATFPIDQLTSFLVQAKRSTYAADTPAQQTAGFKELEFKDGLWQYVDRYTGFYGFTGKEIVSYQNSRVWEMDYVGEISRKLWGQRDVAKEIYAFLRKALLQIPQDAPFRGPKRFKEGDFEYASFPQGDISDFRGHEMILQGEREVFHLLYHGGFI